LGEKVNPLFLLIRIIFYPLKVFAVLVYPELLKNKILFVYCWYRNKQDYNKIVNSYIDGETKSYETWLEDSELKLKNLDGKMMYIKIAMQPDPFKSWLYRKKLDNNVENRKRYAIEVYESVKKTGIENKV